SISPPPLAPRVRSRHVSAHPRRPVVHDGGRVVHLVRPRAGGPDLSLMACSTPIVTRALRRTCLLAAWLAWGGLAQASTANQPPPPPPPAVDDVDDDVDDDPPGAPAPPPADDTPESAPSTTTPDEPTVDT